MSERAIGRSFVVAQIVLLGLLIFLPTGDDFTIADWLRTAADVAFWAGIALAVVAGISLGRALTATPVPTTNGDLRTNGLYRLVRHPIYTGVILIVVAISVRSQSYLTIAIGVVTLAFFDVKARWEEGRLAERYLEYPAYAARTPRFLPGGRLLRR